MRPSWTTCQSEDCCFSELGLYISTQAYWSSIQSGPRHHLIDVAEKFLSWRQSTITHSLIVYYAYAD